MGVRRAMDIALGAILRKEGPIRTYGPLIHNPQILQILEEKGLRSIPEQNWTQDSSLWGKENCQTLIIRAHGISPAEREEIQAAGIRILDATCPHVGKVQGILRRFAKEGYSAIIIGDPDHAEVMGLLGYTEGRGFVVRTEKDVANLPALEKVCVVAQTTQDEARFQDLVKTILQRFPQAQIFNTICSSTRRRQEEVLALARTVDAMVVVGGKQSGNTRRLAEISEAQGVPTFHVETEKDLDASKLERFSTIGITAGASTPHWLILKVVEKLRDLAPHKGLLARLAALGRFLVIGYVFLALGAASLTLAGTILQGLPIHTPSPWMAALYVFSMHVLNRYADREAEKYKQPWRTGFYERQGRAMILAGILSAFFALLLGWLHGPIPFLVLVAISALGMIYNLRVFPHRIVKHLGYAKLREIPGSKSLFVAMAWGVVTALLPALAAGNGLSSGAGVAFLYSSILVFVRCTFYDFNDIQGDLMVGQETIPSILGRRRTEILVVALLIFLAGLLGAAGPWGWASFQSPRFLPSLGYVVIYYWLYRTRVLRGGVLFEGVVDGSFIFAGLWALALQMIES
jgi:(E)-4-hydroxy-3-methyl-but-2-enyl pyrophosphate reductase